MGVFLEVKSRRAAFKVAPWAVSVAKVCGGYQAFASRSDYEIWRKQK